MCILYAHIQLLSDNLVHNCIENRNRIRYKKQDEVSVTSADDVTLVHA